ncbi:hypothetical protein bthur0010_7940 [Bacillus thuringiensis serovar pondicheriensis BGSC 4BA1]|nr:hypothetical protein bthur0010_7940 [Bacillus thuringiensis serovar pondicheriensis BGSC 4BA1]EEM91017.1 hypothetical protein bthur0012_8230 [Bacillus thuringiensis serovar pulsiensis BGSC 4CC1]
MFKNSQKYYNLFSEINQCILYSLCIKGEMKKAWSTVAGWFN